MIFLLTIILLFFIFWFISNLYTVLIIFLCFMFSYTSKKIKVYSYSIYWNTFNKFSFLSVNFSALYNSYINYFFFIFSKLYSYSNNLVPLIIKQWYYTNFNIFYRMKYEIIRNTILSSFIIFYNKLFKNIYLFYYHDYYIDCIENLVQISFISAYVSNYVYNIRFYLLRNFLYYLIKFGLNISNYIHTSISSWWLVSQHIYFDINFIEWISDLNLSDNWNLTIILLSFKDYSWLLKHIIYFFQRFHKIRRGYMYLKTTRSNTFISFNTVIPLTKANTYISSFGDIPESSNLDISRQNVFNTFNKYHNELVQYRVLKTWSSGTVGFSRKYRRSPKAIIALRLSVLAFLHNFFKKTKLDYFTLYINGIFGVMKPFYRMIRKYLSNKYWELKKSYYSFKRKWKKVCKFLSRAVDTELAGNIYTLFDYYSQLSEFKNSDNVKLKKPVSISNSVTNDLKNSSSLYKITTSESLSDFTKNNITLKKNTTNLPSSKKIYIIQNLAAKTLLDKKLVLFDHRNDPSKIVNWNTFFEIELYRYNISNKIKFCKIYSTKIDEFNNKIDCIFRTFFIKKKVFSMLPTLPPLNSFPTQSKKPNLADLFPITDEMATTLSYYFPDTYKLPSENKKTIDTIPKTNIIPVKKFTSNASSFTFILDNTYLFCMFLKNSSIKKLSSSSFIKNKETKSEFIARFSPMITHVESNRFLKKFKLAELVRDRIKMFGLILYLPRSYFIQDLTTYPFNGCKRVRRYCKSKSKSKSSIY
jgi:hypothetical protein